MKKIHLFRKPQIIGYLIICLLLAAWPVLFAATAPASETEGLDWATLIIGLLGGLGIFLFGMEQMSESMKNVAGSRMRDILAKLSNNRIMGLITGTVVTAVIQSSSVTTVMLVGFVTAGLMSFSQSIAIILGADIGTTITAQIVAFKVTKYALVMVAVGVGMQFISKKEKIKQYGLMIMGLGLVFYGMSVMSGAMKPLRSYQPFLDLMAQMDNPILGILVSTIFTGLVQSSSATTGVVIVLGMQGVINLEGGIALILGANIGTCMTAGLAAIGKPREAVRVAIAHVSFKLMGVLLILPFISYLADMARWLSPVADPTLTGQALLAAEVPRQIANSHTLFNVGMAMAFLPFTSYFAYFINRITPDQKKEEEGLQEIRYMDPVLIETPSLALEAARHEMQRVGFRVSKMFEKITPAVNQGTPEDLDEFEAMNEEASIIRQHIQNYLSLLSEKNMGIAETRTLMSLMATLNDLGTISEIVRTDLVELGRKRIEQKIQTPEKISRNFEELAAAVSKSLTMELTALEDLDQEMLQQVIQMEKPIESITGKGEKLLVELLEEEKKGVASYVLLTAILSKLQRVFYYIDRIAINVSKSVEFEEQADAA
ncbi:MAG: Na/Pi cotransporter family protein [SAR324 cluster bacterium]|nr:Na/Pi cotransporter family protein [SAR324 cluster bacterium]